MKNKGLIIPALSLAALVVTGGAVFGYAVYDNYTFLADNNVQLSAELSNVRVARYTAVGDISAGDEIVYEGEGKNVELRQVYCSYPENFTSSPVRIPGPCMRRLTSLQGALCWQARWQSRNHS